MGYGKKFATEQEHRDWMFEFHEFDQEKIAFVNKSTGPRKFNEESWLKARWEILHFQPEASTGIRPDPPAWKQWDKAYQAFVNDKRNLVIGGQTGSGKSIMAWLLGMVIDGKFHVLVAQRRKAAQEVNAEHAEKITRLEFAWMCDF